MLRIKRVYRPKRNNYIVSKDASTNDDGWCMQDVWNWGNEARDFVAAIQPKQRIKYGNNTVMLSKSQPIEPIFASELM